MFREAVLAALRNPDAAVWIMALGGLLILLEFHRPGWIAPGACGTVLALLGAYGLGTLPLRPLPVALVAVAAILPAIESRLASRAVLATLGTACLVIGLGDLVVGPPSQQRVHWVTAAAAGGGFSSISFVLVGIARRARENKRPPR